MSFKPGVYRHYRGGLYRALFLVQDATKYDLGDLDGKHRATDALCVVYVVLDGPRAGTVCVRTLEQWDELVSPPGALHDTLYVPRFTFVYD